MTTRSRLTLRPAACTLLALLLFALPALAQEPAPRLGGIVLDEGSGVPLSGARVAIPELDRSTRTGPSGRWSLDAPAGEWTLVVSLPGHGEVHQRVLVGREAVEPIRTLLPTGILFTMDRIQALATRTDRTGFEVPAPVDVMDSATIQDLQADQPVADVFPLQPGLDVEGSGPFLGRPVIRGLSGNRVLVLVDGQRLNNSREAINFGGVEPALVAAGDVESIEVVRGPGSVLHGTDAIGGIVHITTRRTALPESGVVYGARLSSRYSSADEQRSGRLELNVAGPRLGLVLRGGAREAEPYESAEGEVPLSGAETRDLSADLRWRPALDQDVRLEWSAFRGEDVGVPGTGGVFSGFYPFTDRTQAAIGWTARNLAASLDRLEVRAYLQNQEESFATILDLPPIPAGPFQLFVDTESERTSDVRTTGLDVQATSALGESHVLTWGVEAFRDDVDETRLEESVRTFEPRTPGPPPRTEVEIDDAPTTPESSFRGIGVYLQDELAAGRWTLVPGVRFDRFDIETDALERPEGVIEAEDRTESAVSGSLGALFRASDALHLTASIGRAFRTPNIIERFFFGPGSQGGLSVPNPALENETSLNVDVGAKLRSHGWSGEIAAFRNQVNDLITFVPAEFMGETEFGGQPVTSVGNVAEALLWGVEAEVTHAGELLGGRRWIRLAGSWMRGENRTDDEPVFVSPAKALLSVGWTDRAGILSGRLDTRLVDGQDRVPEGFEPTSGFLVLGAHAAIGLGAWTGGDWTLRMGVENLLDRSYTESFGGAPAIGRNVIISVDAGFGSLGGR